MQTGKQKEKVMASTLNEVSEKLFMSIFVKFTPEKKFLRTDASTYTYDSASQADIWIGRSFLLIEQCPGPSSRCDHIS